MPQQPANSLGKGKKKDRPPSRANTPTPPPPPTNLAQLKSNIAEVPGIIKNTSEALDFLTTKQWLIPDQKITNSHLATVLLSLVATTSPRKTTEKIPDATSNVIKAVAFLLEEVTIAEYAEKILQYLTDLNPPIPAPQINTDTASQINETLTSIKETVTKHTETIHKTDEVLAKLQDSQKTLAENHHQTYRDALLNGQPSATRITTPQEMKIQNRLNINDRQIMFEVQAESEDFLKTAFPDVEKPTIKMKTSLNQWIESNEETNQALKKANVRAITQYRKNKFLIEANTREVASWIKANSTQFLQRLIGHPVKILGRLYPVVARFMPVLFHTNEEGICELENSANLPPHSISHVSWIKNPDNRADRQRYANIKIFCKSAETANQLIIDGGRFKHLDSSLRIHKDIKVPSPCHRCQNYGHISTECSTPNPTCAKCAESHPTTKCASTSTKCTPCGSVDHRTNDENCPERRSREQAILTNNPEALLPYYITHEQWTWGLHRSDPNTSEAEIPPHNPNKSGPSKSRTKKQTSNNQGHQSTLFDGGIHRQQPSTGSNSTPIGTRKHTDQEDPTPADGECNDTSPNQLPNNPPPPPPLQQTQQTTTTPSQ